MDFTANGASRQMCRAGRLSGFEKAFRVTEPAIHVYIGQCWASLGFFP